MKIGRGRLVYVMASLALIALAVMALASSGGIYLWRSAATPAPVAAGCIRGPHFGRPVRGTPGDSTG